MKLTRPGPWIGIMSLGVVLYLALGDMKRNSPGPLASVHAMAVGNSCSACHGGWFQEMTDACLECHEPIAKQLEESAGLHGTFGAERARACTACHSDHHGAGFAIVNDHTFLMAGVPDKAKFDHDRVGFTMTQRHLEVACVACHKQADAISLAEGQHRYLGLDQDCSSCHEDNHGGKYVLSCDECHSQQDFKVLEAKGHDKVLPLIGGHSEVSCEDCHNEGDIHSLESLGRGRQPRLRQCIECHDSPHKPRFLTAVARAEGIRVDASCKGCHEHGHDTFRDPKLTLTADQHAMTGFVVESQHSEVECSSCHAADRESFRGRYPGRTQDACAACHEDPHGGQFATGRFAETGCVGCHDRHQFEPHAFTPEKHSGGAMALTGSHLDQECSACHVDPAEGESRQFHGMDTNCANCHEDAHREFFAERQVARGGCERCHDATKFSVVKDGVFDHRAWTGFLVTGAHAEQDCESCHKPTDEPDSTGRSFGRIEDRFGAYTGCVTCHQDPHEDRFTGVPAAPGVPAALGVGAMKERQGCERCHSQVSFRSLPHGFDHEKWTGFSVLGAHKSAGCAACHKPMRRADKLGRTWNRARGTKCVDCHQDPHLGQFERRGETDCMRCHKSQTKFAELKFRHNLDSRFELGEAHKKVACATCHRPVKLSGGVAVQYRGLNRDCAACHGDQNQILRGRRRRR